MAELAETGAEGANLVSRNDGLEKAEDLLVGYAGDLDWLEVPVSPLLEVQDFPRGSQCPMVVWHFHRDLSIFKHLGQLEIVAASLCPSQLDELARPFHHAPEVSYRHFK